MPTHFVRRVLAGAALALLVLPAAACQQEAEGDKAGPMSRMGGGEEKSGGNGSNERVRDNREPREDRRDSDGRRDASGNGSAAAADRFDRRVRIINGTDMTIMLVKGSPVGQRDWGADRIPTSTIAPGQSEIVDFNDNNGECRYDLQATLQDQSTREQRGVNICQIAEWRIGTSGDVLN